MPEYYIIRLLLACALAWPCLQVWIFEFDMPPEILRYFVCMAIYQMLPQALWSEVWWSRFWLPAEMVQAILTWFACSATFRIATRARTFWWERVDVLMFSGCIAGAVVIFSWLWAPRDAFESFVVIRQYYRLGLATAWLSISAWFGWLRPLTGVQPETKALGFFWCLWLTCQFLMSTTGAACLSWQIVERKTGMWWYRSLSDLLMIVQVFAVIWYCGHLRRRTIEYV